MMTSGSQEMRMGRGGVMAEVNGKVFCFFSRYLNEKRRLSKKEME